MRLAFLGLLSCAATAAGATYTDAEIREMVERQRAFDKTVTRVAPAAVIQHIARIGVVLRPQGAEWQVDRPAPPPDCGVHTQFMVFAPGTSREEALAYTSRFNAWAMLNERATIAMFYPSGRGEGCVRDRAAFQALQERLADAFKSYVP